MLAISPLKSLDGGEENINIEREGEILFEDINFDDLFQGLEDGDALPDLEIDPSDIFADFSFSSCEESGNNTGEKSLEGNENRGEDCKESSREEVEVVSARTGEDVKGLKASVKGPSKLSHGKKKAKVDWTPELHRRFVQAVEQLGVDKAVPSRILELMGIDCLTRHNIASHLQKYRSHRKHLLAREAEAASSWSHRRQMMYRSTGGVVPVHGSGAAGATSTKMMNVNPNWGGPLPPTIGFPTPMLHQPSPLVRPPLHVWGHPSVEQLPQLLVPVWPQPPWGPPPRPPHGVMPPAPSFWHHPRYPRPLTQGTPCFPPPPRMQPTRYPTPPAHGIPPPHPMYSRPPAPPIKKSTSQVQLDAAQPSNESIDAAIGDVLAKPWLPLPLGLKPPSLDSVMVELQNQGAPDVP